MSDIITGIPSFVDELEPEHNNWTPIIRSTNDPAEPTYWAQTGFYTKIGPIVFLKAVVNASSVMPSYSGSLEIHGLPFPGGFRDSIIFGEYSGFNVHTLGHLTGIIPKNEPIIRLNITSKGGYLSPLHIKPNSVIRIDSYYSTH